jgi:hypothetical protein
LKHNQLTIVPAGSIGSVSIKFTVYQPGPFECQIEVFLEDNGIRTTSVAFKGVGIAPEGLTNGKPST